MSATDSLSVWRLLEKLGPPEFGLVAQAILGACFNALGARIEAVNHQGHPDLQFHYMNQDWKVEVEFSDPGKTDFEIKAEDLSATGPLSETEVGYLAILDCNFPVNWKLVSTARLMAEGNGPISLSKLGSLSEPVQSKTCTDWSLAFFREHETEIPEKRFPGLCRDYIAIEGSE